ncbi:tRNA lysidine(34) synthetase TilS [sulfur-oxidizing endosymbiont of Gigantopelta aegis]|uniref:tRNA lysidine(34) synthetase TilS n=1 Tax=sulfur-oxidizing endosymbiont of Gigantopelta aegis TaxID=2794934 RepID=UPI0018DC8C66|nr:tRNA lysidine(34) synthetase TilS [sulfur-oxidizing endosymbiont of Gigantopelta aegis]
MSITPQAFHFHLEKISKADKFLVAYSGGVDSHVLLHLCSQLKNSPNGFEQSFSAVYIDHGLSSQAKKWGQHCQHICFELDIPLTIIEVDARPKNGQSPEAAARLARYHAFSQILAENECLLTAQHLDDQAETLLLQLLRGAGTKGLSAMPRSKTFAKGFLCRPIIDYQKQAIIDYAKQHQLEWVEDESNLEQRFDRNYLRHTIMPLLEERWPAVKENFAKSAEILSESQSLLDELAENDAQHLFFKNAEAVLEKDKLLITPTLSLLKKSPLELARLNNLLRYWIHRNELPLPSKKILEQIVHHALFAGDDAMPLVAWTRENFHCEIRRYRDKLYLLDVSFKQHNLADFDSSQILILDESIIGVELKIVNTNRCIQLLSCEATQTSAAYNCQQLFSKPITIRFRKGGERYRKHLDGHSHPLKHWFQEQGIPPWEREQMPLVFWGDELVQIGHNIVNQSLKSAESNDLVMILWQTCKNK